MADEAFRHKFSAEWVGDLSCSLSSSLYLSSSPSSFFFFAFPADTCRQAHTSREPTSEKCNLSISAPQRKDKQCWKNEGINTLPSWCWTNMSRSLQFTNGPATFGAHRCGNSRTNLIAPAAAVVVSGFVCLSCFVSLLLFDRFAPSGMRSSKMTGEGWVLLKDENKGISLHQTLSLEERISNQVHSELLKQELRGIEGFINASWPERAAAEGKSSGVRRLTLNLLVNRVGSKRNRVYTGS